MLVIAVSLLAGCYYPTGDEVSVSLQGSVNATDASIAIDGNLTANGIPEEETYEDVRVVMYDDQGNVLRSDHVGDLDAESGQLRINVSTTERPEYITFESDDFWNEPNIQVVYFYRADTGEYRPEVATERSELPGS